MIVWCNSYLPSVLGIRIMLH